ncbi:MAG: tRNA (adenosine(37)-N6)-threonylcarbamoyltransferase complex ATPase subunit type 1 TsaE [Bacilli bacterium]|nr:tRNA (adenosine(37)-N6)-threonylcarbamoyltransferase complex ATPase subunit type 1 TsaE [Bacilli bacterium]
MDNTYKITTHNDVETIEVAQNIESEKFPNMVICLNGDLGSGKTVFAKGFASAMGIDEITSPTFNILKQYYGELPLNHIDVYRTNGDVASLGLDELFNSNAVTIIEWAEMIEENLPEERLDIMFKITGDDTRLLIIKPHGEKYIRVCEDAL